MELNEILQVALRGGASDIHLKAGLPPMFRIDGNLVPLKDARRLPPEEISRMALGIMNDYQKEKFKAQNELDLAYGVPGLGRFRVNVFQQRGTVGVVLRVIPFKISTIDQLLLPKVLEKIAGEQRGLILVTGTTGSGKSTTLAGMVDHINSNETCHIMTIEDPIEFLIRDKRSIVNQREVGVDTMSFRPGAHAALPAEHHQLRGSAAAVVEPGRLRSARLGHQRDERFDLGRLRQEGGGAAAGHGQVARPSGRRRAPPRRRERPPRQP